MNKRTRKEKDVLVRKLYEQIMDLQIRLRDAKSELRLITTREVERIAGISKSEIWRRIHNGTFPRPAKLSKSERGGSRWEWSDVQHWIRKRLLERDLAKNSTSPKVIQRRKSQAYKDGVALANDMLRTILEAKDNEKKTN